MHRSCEDEVGQSRTREGRSSYHDEDRLPFNSSDTAMTLGKSCTLVDRSFPGRGRKKERVTNQNI